MHGSVTRVDLGRGAGRLRDWTGQVLANNGFTAGGQGDDRGRGARAAGHGDDLNPRRSVEAPIKHVIFVTKENRTFD